MKYSAKTVLIAGLLTLSAVFTGHAQKAILIQPAFTYMDASGMAIPPAPGDTLKIVAGRILTLKFKYLQGTPDKPIVIINYGGQVSISTSAWGALSFENCKYIKVTGTGDKTVRYGFKLQGIECGLSFSEYSTDCEAEFIEIVGSGSTFFGIYAKKDFGGTPPVPYPQFNNLLIHDNYIHDVTEGMYIGETKSPGMEFRHVRVYNNIVENTGREAVQLANCVEDVEVHHNLFRNSGFDNEAFQNNCLQIGGNTVGKYYNNLLINSPGYGVIIMGMGNIEVYSNYIENNPGSFIDDRYWPIPNSPITLKNNYFRSSVGNEIIKNLNQYNNMYFQDNSYDTNIPFLTNSGGTPPILVNSGNTLGTVPPILYEVVNGVFKINPAGPAVYAQIGPASPPPPASARIQLNQQMITDQVIGGSLNSPKYLVDEQQLNPDLNQHPLSIPWKPAKTVKYAPFHIYFDLGAEYFIDRISLHDLSTTGKVIVSYGTPDNWINLFTDPVTKSKTWSQRAVRITSRYIRLSLISTLDAKINEIALYGYRMSTPENPGTQSLPLLKSGMAGSEASLNPGLATDQEFNVYPNPVVNQLSVSPFTSGMTVELMNPAGSKILSCKRSTLDLSGITEGTYILRVTNTAGRVVHQTKIIKVR